jgi:low temperature requirement protein LtrA
VVVVQSSPMALRRIRQRDHAHRHADNRGKAVPLELFFDLVFVFAFTQVTQFLADNVSWSGLARGLALLAVLWWAWVGYSWLGSAVDPEEGTARVAFFVAMAAMFVVALSTGDALGDAAFTFAIAYLIVRLVHVGVFAMVSWHDPTFRRAVLTLAPGFVVAPTLLIVAAFFDGSAQATLWILALVVDFGSPVLGGSAGWQITPSHFAERHGLIVIIGLGEAIVSVGVGESGIGVSADVVVVAVIAIAIAAAFWWTYFDVVAIVAERKLHEARPGVEQNRMARDSYSYLHYFLIAAVVLVALGAKKTAGYPDKELDIVVATALGGGAALYLVTLSMLRWRNIGTPNWRRLIAAAVIASTAIPLGAAVNGTAALIAIVTIYWVLVAIESITFRDARHEIRHHGGNDHHTPEAPSRPAEG